MALLSQAELDACRAMQAQTFDKTVTVQRVSQSVDPWSATGKDAWANLITGPASVGTVACRIATPSARLIQQYQGQLGNVPIWIVTYAITEDIAQGDLLITDDAHALTVHEVLKPHGYETARRAIVAEKQ